MKGAVRVTDPILLEDVVVETGATICFRALLKAKSMNKYAVIGEPKTYCSYNEGWQDAIDFIMKEVNEDN